MSSSQLPSHSPGEEVYHAAKEYDSYYVQSSSGASSTVTTTPDGSVYATADQTPTASPDIDRCIVPSVPVVAQDQDRSESFRPIEESTEERRERSSLNATVASRAPSIAYLAEASTNLGQQRECLMQLSELRGLEKDEDITGKPAYLAIVSAKHRHTSLPESFTQRGTCNQASQVLDWRKLLSLLLKERSVATQTGTDIGRNFI